MHDSSLSTADMELVMTLGNNTATISTELTVLTKSLVIYDPVNLTHVP